MEVLSTRGRISWSSDRRRSRRSGIRSCATYGCARSPTCFPSTQCGPRTVTSTSGEPSTVGSTRPNSWRPPPPPVLHPVTGKPMGSRLISCFEVRADLYHPARRIASQHKPPLRSQVRNSIDLLVRRGWLDREAGGGCAGRRGGAHHPGALARPPPHQSPL